MILPPLPRLWTYSAQLVALCLGTRGCGWPADQRIALGHREDADWRRGVVAVNHAPGAPVTGSANSSLHSASMKRGFAPTVRLSVTSHRPSGSVCPCFFLAFSSKAQARRKSLLLPTLPTSSGTKQYQ